MGGGGDPSVSNGWQVIYIQSIAVFKTALVCYIARNLN